MKKKKKNDVTLNISKHFTKIFDHQLDIVNNIIKELLKLFKGFGFFSSPSNLNLFDFLAQNVVIAKVTSSNLVFFGQHIFFFGM